MQVQRVQNNNYNQTFASRYVVKGTQKEINSFMYKVREFIDIEVCSSHIMLNYSPDMVLICTDQASKEANLALQNSFKIPFKSYQRFAKLPLEVQLKKIFGDGAKDVKQYDAKEILESPNFDYIEGIIK